MLNQGYQWSIVLEGALCLLALGLGVGIVVFWISQGLLGQVGAGIYLISITMWWWFCVSTFDGNAEAIRGGPAVIETFKPELSTTVP